MQEIWRKHPTLESIYVSSFGQIFMDIKCDSHPNGHYTYGTLNHYGYYVITHNKKQYKVHRLVAETFLPNPNNYPIINHKDENPKNNCVNNLEWCSYLYNNTYGTRLKRMSTKRSIKIKRIDVKTNEEKTYNSITDCVSDGFSKGNVSQCLNNKYLHSGNNIYKGFKWLVG